MQLALTAVLFALLAFTNSMIPMRPRPLPETHNATATEVSTAKPVLELRRVDRGAVRNKDKDADCSEERKPAKPKDGKIVNTGEIEKQIIVNIENHLRPEFKINLGGGMLRNILCGNNFSITCEPPELTTPKARQPTQARTRKPPKVIMTSTMDESSETTDAITISEVTSEGTESVEPTTRHRKPRKPTRSATVIVSVSHPTDEPDETSPADDDGGDDDDDDDGNPIVVEYSVPSITDDSGETTEPYTRKKPEPTRRTGGRPTRKQPKRTTTEAPGRGTTKCRWTKRTTRRTTELTAEISQTVGGDETETTTEIMRIKPTKPRRRTTKPREVITQGFSPTFLDSAETTTSEPPESTESGESTESCESTEPPESTEFYSVTFSQSYRTETEPQEPDYTDEEPSAETPAQVRKTTRKPRKGGKIITKLNCTDLFPPTGNKKPRRLRKRDLISLELLKMKCSDDICV